MSPRHKTDHRKAKLVNYGNSATLFIVAAITFAAKTTKYYLDRSTKLRVGERKPSLLEFLQRAKAGSTKLKEHKIFLLLDKHVAYHQLILC